MKNWLKKSLEEVDACIFNEEIKEEDKQEVKKYIERWQRELEIKQDAVSKEQYLKTGGDEENGK